MHKLLHRVKVRWRILNGWTVMTKVMDDGSSTDVMFRCTSATDQFGLIRQFEAQGYEL